MDTNQINELNRANLYFRQIIAKQTKQIIELKERIKFAIDYLPESPDKAMQFLTPILDKKEKVAKFECHEARDCFPCDAITNGCFDELRAENEKLKRIINQLKENKGAYHNQYHLTKAELEKYKRLKKNITNAIEHHRIYCSCINTNWGKVSQEMVNLLRII